MGLRSAFLSDLIPYRLAADMDPDIFGQFTYNGDLIAAPRVYGEEVTGVGAVWGGRDPNIAGPSSVSFLASMRQIYWPSWSLARWRMDGQKGHLLERQVSPPGATAVMTTYPAFSVEPGGTLWWWGNPYAPRAAALRTETLEASGATIEGADFGLLQLRAFAIDRGADRVFLGTGVGQVAVYRLSTKTKLADLFTPGEIIQVVLTHDGYAYLVDTLEWICAYDYDGTLVGAMRASRALSAPKGLCYGWDAYYKRILRVVGSAPATDGASTMRVGGFYPQPEAWELTPPLPLKVPRKGRTIYSLAHMAGEGGEPLAGRRLTFTTGGVSSTSATDANGDARAAITPGVAGALLVQVTE